MKKFVQAFEPKDKKLGAEITYSTPGGRKSFQLPRPANPKPAPPMAIESFAFDPEQYFMLMDGVSRLNPKFHK